MSSSSAPTEGVDINGNLAPKGWTVNRYAMMEDYYWVGNSDDIKGMLQTDYSLESVQPLWRHDPKYGSIMFIFQARAGPEEKMLYYVWNGIESSVCRFVEEDIKKIWDVIDNNGKGPGYLKGLQQEVVHPSHQS